MSVSGLGNMPFRTNGSDFLANLKNYPGISFFGTESGASISDVREIAGQTWITANAFFNADLRGYQQQNPILASAAIVITPGAAPQQAVAAAGAPTPIVWTLSNIGGTGVVTSVTASAPLSSSGGTAPNITLSGIVNVAEGGTGTATPGLIAGTNITITGAWPDQTINSTASGGFPAVPLVIGSGSVYTVATNTQVPYGTQIHVQAGGQIYTAGTGVLQWVH